MTGHEVGATTPQVRAAGGVVLRGDEPQVLVVHRPRYDDWSLPKGKVDPGESWPRAAVREVHEETGVTARLGVELSPTRYTDHAGREKVVRWWQMHVLDVEERAPDDEVDRVDWISPEQAHDRLTYTSDRDLVREALAVRDHRTVLLVRHAHAGDRADWDGDDDRRPLSPTGRRQVAGMVDHLAPYHVTRVASSPAVRCLQTAEPVARARGLDVVTEDRLAEGADPATTWDLVAAAGAGTVLTSHGDVVGAIVARLRDHGVVGDTAAWPKASTWVLHLDGDGRPRAADHLPAPSVRGEQRPRTRLGPAHRVQVTPEHVGERVTIRHLVDDDGQQVATDVLGHLRSWEGDRLRVERRDGRITEVDATTIVASRVIPPAPPRRRPREG